MNGSDEKKKIRREGNEDMRKIKLKLERIGRSEGKDKSREIIERNGKEMEIGRKGDELED